MINIIPGNQLTIRDTPRGAWYAGSAFIAISGLVGILLARSYFIGNFAKSNMDGWLICAFFLIPLGVFLGGLHFLLRQPVTTTIIDPAFKTIMIERKYLTGSREHQNFRFSEIEGNVQLKHHRHEGWSYYTPQIKPKNGEIIALLSAPTQNEQECRGLIEKANAYLGL